MPEFSVTNSAGALHARRKRKPVSDSFVRKEFVHHLTCAHECNTIELGIAVVEVPHLCLLRSVIYKVCHV